MFILSAEVLAKAIRKDKKIVGILVNNKEIKLSQYADDTTLTLDGSKKSLVASLEMLDDFYEVSGLRLTDSTTQKLKRFGSEVTVVRIQFNSRGEALNGLDIKSKL